MENKIFKPSFDKLTFWIYVPTAVFMVAMTVLSAFAPVMLLIMIPADLLIGYFFITPFFGYVELREKSLFIKFGFFMKKEIFYDKIRRVEKDRRFYSESMMSLKNALDHVNIRFNTYDVVTVSVVNMDEFIEELNTRRQV